MMASKTLRVVIAGDASGAQKAFHDVSSGAASSAGKAKASFAAAGGAIAAAFGPQLEPIMAVTENFSGAFDKLKGKSKSVGTVLAGTGVAALGAGAVVQQVAAKDIEAQAQLKAQIETTGKSWEDYEKRVEGSIKSEEHYGHTADDTQTALRNLTAATNSPAKALKYMDVVTNLAAAKHISLAASSELVSKILNGKGARTLAAYGITMVKTGAAAKGLAKAQALSTRADDAAAKAKRKLSDLIAVQGSKTKLGVSDQIALRNAEEDATSTTDKAAAAHKSLAVATDYMKHAAEGGGVAIDQLGVKLKGQAAAQADTFSGKMKALKARVEDAASAFGAKWGTTLMGAGAATGLAGGAIDALRGPLGRIPGLASSAGSSIAGIFKPGGLKDGISLRFMAIGDKAKAMGSKIAGAASALAGWGKSAVVAAANGLRTAAAFVAEKVASAAAAIAEKAQAAAQWLLNAAMDANPIGLVIAAIAALVAIFVVAYKRVGWFHDAVDASFRAIAAVGSWLWNNVLKVIFSQWVAIAEGVGRVALWLWHNAIDPAFQGVAAAAGWMWDHTRPAFSAISDGVSVFVQAFLWARDEVQSAFSWIGKTIQYVWNAYIDPVWKYMQGFLDTIGSIGDSVGNVLSNLPGLGALGHANGTPSARAGWSVVGERGPELVKLGQGTQVLNNQRSQALLSRDSGGGGGAQIHVVVNVNGSMLSDEKKVASAVANALIRTQRTQATPLLAGVRS